ncbi:MULTISPECIES: SigB/SigF/SigG family RNA polymerase sigma factor [unclassified Streptomyces]|uniref:SigB/SigF/SigG family RNA polymerase sigma factor n=1 Tax=unclassified Streptomyces TaxID=2593676 RepID=UPI002DDB729E|nr:MULTISPECIES: SigB/SigF/SigG family RNA polymerase sigma factor [unclassified Streptomyces]WSA91888.1 SigB/SigF/SigG family RNA polymerase sigma factor [Streptomyces sp. NBC_01795]WSB76256.1 SigB/SigF/SigG family RNA polymerase sigma factor [Streptomyces sp. NBC_01775]WSS44311.1 SigB/SigF/SigG family RNA polymerase sigma factor [Streptomyces sp. NBC_01187]
MSTVRYRAERARHSHEDAPDTVDDFKKLAALPEGPERQALSERLVEAWLPMAHRLAAKYRSRGETLEDLEQVAALGLVKAVDRYDPAHGTPFVPFAVPTIVGEIRRHFRDHTWDVHVPRRIQELRNKVRASVKELNTGIDGRSPSVERIAEHSGLSEEDVKTGLEALESFSSLSLDAALGGSEDGMALADVLGHSEPRYDAVVAREAVKPCLQELPERQRRVLYLRFFCGMTQSKIGEELGVSQMHVSRLISRSCQEVRQKVEHDHGRRHPSRGQHAGIRPGRRRVTAASSATATATATAPASASATA